MDDLEKQWAAEDLQDNLKKLKNCAEKEFDFYLSYEDVGEFYKYVKKLEDENKWLKMSDDRKEIIFRSAIEKGIEDVTGYKTKHRDLDPNEITGSRVIRIVPEA